jgi:diguanylate cyclase (GGDEF)-like protein/PAS domain S-box-containing protein
LFSLAIFGLSFQTIDNLGTIAGISTQIAVWIAGAIYLATAYYKPVLGIRRGGNGSEFSVMVSAIALGIIAALALALAEALHGFQAIWLFSGLALVGAMTLVRHPLAVAIYALILCNTTLFLADSIDSAGILITALIAAAVYAVALWNQNILKRCALRINIMQERAHTAETLIKSFEESGNHWLWETDQDHQITYISQRFATLLGQEGNSLIGTSFLDALANFSDPAEKHPAIQTLRFHTSAHLPFRDIILPLSIDNGELWLSFSGGLLKDERGQFSGYSGFSRDLTDSRQSEERAKQLAHYDSLTGLANRSHFHQILGQLLRRALTQHSPCTLMFIDLDRFKMVNDTLGHPVGDELLKEVARRIEHVIKDGGRAGRLGGDEFVVALPNGLDRASLSRLAKRLIAELSAPYHIGPSKIQIGASIGLATAPEDGKTSDELIGHADLAIYAAKQQGRGTFCFYEAQLSETAQTRQSLEIDLREALANGELELAYQPIFDLRDDSLTGFEALLRWNHPARGMISPEKFIPIAEECGLIVPVGEWVLRTALNHARSWPKQVKIAINLSPLQLQEAELAGKVMNALAATQIDPGRVELEITESVFLQETSISRQNLKRLGEMGLKFALDDFGTGYSSLGYLHQGCFSKIKIDRSFVDGVDTRNSRNNSIVRAVVALAESLDMITTAEGAETDRQINALKEIGCRQVQGFACGEPIDIDAATILASSSRADIDNRVLQTRDVRLAMLKKINIDACGRKSIAVLKNLSPTGAMFDADRPILLGTRVNLVISELNNPSGIIRWTQGVRIGLEFEERIAMELWSHVEDNASNIGKDAAIHHAAAIAAA